MDEFAWAVIRTDTDEIVAIGVNHATSVETVKYIKRLGVNNVKVEKVKITRIVGGSK